MRQQESTGKPAGAHDEDALYDTQHVHSNLDLPEDILARI